MLNLNQLKKLYSNSPLWMKRLYASIPYDIRNGADFRKWIKFLEEELNEEEYKLLKIKESVLYAYENTTYYKRIFDDLHISPFDIHTFKDFANLPFIDKDIVRENYNDLTVESYPSKKTFFVTTGGTSGEPMKFLQSKNVWAKELAYVMDYFSQYGYKPSILKASFRGGEFDVVSANRFWKYNPIHNEMHFSPFHINWKNIIYYVQALNRYKPLYFHSYPSSLLLLIEQMKENGLKLNYKPNAVFLISENFTIDEVKIIQTFFDCEISSFYGHSERLIFAPSNNKNLDTFQIDQCYGICELIDETNSSIRGNGKRGELVGTSFDNYAMPLLRYKTNDYTTYSDYNKQIISSIEGRWTQEYLIGKEGLKLYLTALNMHSDIFKNVIKYQFYQHKPAEAELRVIVNKLYQEQDKSNILHALKQKVGHAVLFNVKVVEQVELTTRGKFKNIIKSFK